jgi:hypothetical protein
LAPPVVQLIIKIHIVSTGEEKHPNTSNQQVTDPIGTRNKIIQEPTGEIILKNYDQSNIHLL